MSAWWRRLTCAIGLHSGICKDGMFVCSYCPTSYRYREASCQQ